MWTATITNVSADGPLVRVHYLFELDTDPNENREVSQTFTPQTPEAQIKKWGKDKRKELQELEDARDIESEAAQERVEELSSLIGFVIE